MDKIQGKFGLHPKYVRMRRMNLDEIIYRAGMIQVLIF